MLPFYRCLQGTCVLVQRVQRVGDFLQRTYHCAAVGCGCLVVRIFGGALLMRTRRRLAESRFRLGSEFIGGRDQPTERRRACRSNAWLTLATLWRSSSSPPKPY